MQEDRQEGRLTGYQEGRKAGRNEGGRKTDF
jgi:flagellar biosynthesis/type III secretory pathway protein FliH